MGQELLASLGNCVAVCLHLLGKIGVKPFVSVGIFIEETSGFLHVDLYRRLSLFTVVEPCLRPKAHSGTVWIYADYPGNVEALHVYVEFGQRVYESKASKSSGVAAIAFFLESESMADR